MLTSEDIPTVIEIDELNSFLASDFCHLLITFGISLDPDQHQQNVVLDLDPNHLTF